MVWGQRWKRGSIPRGGAMNQEKEVPKDDQRQLLIANLVEMVGRLKDAIQDGKDPESMIPAKQELATLIRTLEDLGEKISDKIKDFTK